MQVSRNADRRNATDVWNTFNAVSLCQSADFFSLHNAASDASIWLPDLSDVPFLEILKLIERGNAFAERDRDRRFAGDLLQ